MYWASITGQNAKLQREKSWNLRKILNLTAGRCLIGCDALRLLSADLFMACLVSAYLKNPTGTTKTKTQIFSTAAPAVAAMLGPRTPTHSVAGVTTEVVLAESSVMKDTGAQLGVAGAGASKPSGPFEEAWAKSNMYSVFYSSGSSRYHSVHVW